MRKRELEREKRRGEKRRKTLMVREDGEGFVAADARRDVASELAREKERKRRQEVY